MMPSKRNVTRKENQPNEMPDDFTFEDRNPETMNLIDIQANELSRHHHMGSFFNDHNGPAYDVPIDYKITETESLLAIAEKGGIAMLNHPGRYSKGVNWYVELYNTYDHLIGLEVYNAGDRYPCDRVLWDSILTITMPDRPVWGYSNDDMHSHGNIGRNWNVLVLPELSDNSVKDGKRNGLSYFVYAPLGHTGTKPPKIESVNVNHRKSTIEIKATDFETIQWISGGIVVSEGERLNIKELADVKNYIRAEIRGSGNTVTSTQVFGIKKAKYLFIVL
jgi:hypothetical protein